MNHNEFEKYLKGQYRPDPGQVGKAIEFDSVDDYIDEEGGFLVPNIIMANKAGWFAKVYRKLGRILRSTRLYKKGTVEKSWLAVLVKEMGA